MLLPTYTPSSTTTSSPSSNPKRSIAQKIIILQTVLADTCLSICLFTYLSLFQHQLFLLTSLSKELNWLCLINVNLTEEGGAEKMRELCSSFGSESGGIGVESQLGSFIWWIIFSLIFVKAGLFWWHLFQTSSPLNNQRYFDEEEDSSTEYDFLLFSIAFHAAVGLLITFHLLSIISTKFIAAEIAISAVVLMGVFFLNRRGNESQGLVIVETAGTNAGRDLDEKDLLLF